jgi:hypothetical protein
MLRRLRVLCQSVSHKGHHHAASLDAPSEDGFVAQKLLTQRFRGSTWIDKEIRFDHR